MERDLLILDGNRPHVLSYMKLDYTLFNPLIGIPLNAILTLIISFALVFVMQRIPVIKRIVP